MSKRSDDVLGVFRPGVRLSSAEVGSRVGISVACAVRYLSLLRDKGILTSEKEVVHHVDSKSFSRRFLWSLIGADEAPQPEAPPVLPAYRNRRLGENLTDYGRTLHDFAALCMMVRR